MPDPDAAEEFSRLRSDLVSEQGALDDLVATLQDVDWARPTDSPGWTLADQIAHLTYFDLAAAIAIADPDTFGRMAEDLRAALSLGHRAADDMTLDIYRSMSPKELLAAWREARKTLAQASAPLAAGDRVAWYGPSMSARSFLTARLMEVWAHGADIAKAIGVRREATDRLKHIATLGVITRAWSYLNRGLQPPADDVRVALTAPSGQRWEFGPASAEASVVGGAEDFCLVVTQRAHLDDTALKVRGPAAREWMKLAQCFAGPPTDGPAPS